MKSNSKQIEQTEYNPSLSAVDIKAVNKAKFIFKEVSGILDEYEEAGKTFKESQFYDLRFLLNNFTDTELHHLKTSDVRLYWKLQDLSDRHSSLVVETVEKPEEMK
ncbi:hypothetical protein [Bacillus manliponensis]|uniref:hypothetical protein n=1 Tax=Bacillus manliponensis TaxID=574376 RepID=UPI003516F668